jgi:hypothetical protein
VYVDRPLPNEVLLQEASCLCLFAVDGLELDVTVLVLAPEVLEV